MKRLLVAFCFFVAFVSFAQQSFMVDWTTNKVYSSTIVNVPISANYAHENIQALELAKETARVNYYRALRSIRLSDSGDTVYDFFEASDERKSKLFTLLDNVRLHSVENPDLSTVKVSYFINVYGQKDSIINIIMGGVKHYTEELRAYMGQEYDTNYTGIVIDARGELESFDKTKVIVSPTIFPTIKDSEGNIVFNRYNVSLDAIINGGMVQFSSSVYETYPQRTGEKPLRVVAYGVGDKYGSVIVVSMRDAQQMLSSEATRRAIKQGKICIIIDKQ